MEQTAPDTGRQPESIARFRAAILARVERGELTVHQACREAAISRARFYQLRDRYREQGLDGLLPSPRSGRPDLRLSPTVEDAIIGYARANPEHGERAIARALARADHGGINVSRHGVGEVLRRNGISRRDARMTARASDRSRKPSQTTADDGDYAKLYERYRSYVYAVCLQVMRDPSGAEDATQETFARGYANFWRYDSRRSILPWLRTIATNVCIDMLRRDGRVSVKDPMDETWFEAAAPDEPLNTVIAGERRATLQRALGALPARQRRVLLLYALEGWNYTDIASAEDISVQAVKSIIFRARTYLRGRYAVGALGILGVRLRTVRQRAQRLSHRLGMHVEAAASAFIANATAIERGTLAVIMMLTVGATAGSFQARANATSTGARQSITSAAPATRTELASGRSGSAMPAGPAALAGKIVDPTRNATPENTHFQSIVPSPNYQRDHTIFAAGTVECLRPPCATLFVSRDAGASWTRLRAASLTGTELMLPPAYPQDDRIFVMGPSGIEMSKDGGATFSLVYPLAGGAAISPAFNDREDERRILVGTRGTIMEYWPDRASGLSKPAALVLLPRLWSHVGFAPDYAKRGLILAGSTTPGDAGLYTSEVDQCLGAVCNRMTLPSLGAPAFSFSPAFERDDTVYAFTPEALFVSTDAGASFDRARMPSTFQDGLAAVTVASHGPKSALYVSYLAATNRDTGFHRSLDGGTTWTALRTGIRGFERGVRTVAALGDGTLLAAGIHGGVACSRDDGRTWSARCAAFS